MKGKPNTRQFFCLSLLLAVLFTYPYWRRDFLAIEMDTFFHLARIQSLGESIRRFDLYPLVFASQNGFFGYGSPLFYCNLLLWPFACLYAFHVPLSVCYKLAVFLYTGLSAYTMLRFLFAVTGKRAASFAAAAIWIFASYRISDVYVRGALGEVMAMAFLPLFLESLYDMVTDDEPFQSRLTLALVGVLLSHNLSFVLTMALLLLTLLVFHKRLTPAKCRALLKSLFLSFLLTAWFTLPMLEQLFSQRFYLHYYATAMDLQKEAMTPAQFLQYRILFGVGGYGMRQGTYMTLSPGYLLFFIPFLSYSRRQDAFTKFCFFSGLFFALAPLNIWPWKWFPFLRILQFPWRLETIACLLLAPPCAKGIQRLLQKRSTAGLLMVLVLGDGMVRLLPACSRTFGITSHTPDTFLVDGSLIDPYYSSTYMRTQLAGGDYMPIGSPDFRSYPPTVHDLSGAVVVPESETRTPFYRFTVTKSGTWILPVTWYKGYCVYRLKDGVETAIPTTVSSQRLVQCTVTEPGTYICRYRPTPLWRWSALISVLTGAGLIYTYRSRSFSATDRKRIL